jgi:hypothetical protein
MTRRAPGLPSAVCGTLHCTVYDVWLMMSRGCGLVACVSEERGAVACSRNWATCRVNTCPEDGGSRFRRNVGNSQFPGGVDQEVDS